MSLRRIAVLLLAIGLVLVLARPAWADLVVVLVLPAESRENYEPFATRLRSELMAAGFNVRTVRETEPPSASLLERIAAREGSAAAMAITLSPSAVSGVVWMRDAKAERSLERPIPPEALSDDSPAVFAIRATDVLHGGLLELGYPRPRPPEALQPGPSASASSSAPAPVPSTAPSAPRPVPIRAVHPKTAKPQPLPPAERTWGVEGGATLLWGPGPGGGVQGLGWGVAPTLAIEKRWWKSWATGARLVGPAVSSLRHEQDRATLDQELGLAGGGWRGSVAPGFTLLIDAGLGAYRLGARGEDRGPTPTQPGRKGQYRSEWAGCVYGGLGLGLSLGSRVTTRLNVDAVVPTRKLEIVFANQPVARSGVPILATSLGLFVSL